MRQRRIPTCQRAIRLQSGMRTHRLLQNTLRVGTSHLLQFIRWNGGRRVGIAGCNERVAALPVELKVCVGLSEVESEFGFARRKPSRHHHKTSGKIQNGYPAPFRAEVGTIDDENLVAQKRSIAKCRFISLGPIHALSFRVPTAGKIVREFNHISTGML